METRKRRDVIAELGYEDAIVFENPSYDSAIIGVSHDGRVIYSYDRMIESLMIEDDMDMEDAIEFIDFNTIRSLPYQPNGPIVLYDIPELEDM